jgi:hypothetical protein
VLAAGRALAGDPRAMLHRCAWCRINLGGQWVPDDQVPEFVKSMLQARATHGICRSCLRRLEAAGRSHVEATAGRD